MNLNILVNASRIEARSIHEYTQQAQEHSLLFHSLIPAIKRSHIYFNFVVSAYRCVYSNILDTIWVKLLKTVMLFTMIHSIIKTRMLLKIATLLFS